MLHYLISDTPISKLYYNNSGTTHAIVDHVSILMLRAMVVQYVIHRLPVVCWLSLQLLVDWHIQYFAYAQN